MGDVVGRERPNHDYAARHDTLRTGDDSRWTRSHLFKYFGLSSRFSEPEVCAGIYRVPGANAVTPAQ